jgi:phage tail-like protein
MSTPRQRPFPVSNFLVEIDGITVGGVAEVTPPGGEAAVIWYRSGSDPADKQRAMRGSLSTDSILLRRAFNGDRSLYEWWQLVRIGESGARRSMNIVVLDDEANEVARWNVSGAFPRSHRVDRLEATAERILMETVEIVYEDYVLA